MRTRSRLLDAAAELAWSHWTALGVAGVVPPPSTATDPESLILLTVALGDFDPRLLDEATDWCVRYGKRFVSLSRLRNLRGHVDDSTQHALDELAATTNEHGGTRWPTSARPRRFKPSGKSKLESLDHVSLALLRLRCAFGVSARAELLHMLLTMPSQSDWIAASTFTELGYGKRNLAVMLDDLALSGLLAVRRLGNANGYRLRDALAVRRLFDPLPQRSGRLHLRMPIIARCVAFEQRTAGKEPVVRSVEIKRLLGELEAQLALLELEPPPVGDPKSYADAVSEWVVERIISAR
jgi:hypothetical protein